MLTHLLTPEAQLLQRVFQRMMLTIKLNKRTAATPSMGVAAVY